MATITLSSGTIVSNPFEWGGARYTLTELNDVEKKTFLTQFDGLVGTDDSVIRHLFDDRKNMIEIGICAIKNYLNDVQFEGIYPSDGALGMALIRPMFVGDTTSTPDGKTSWSESITTANTRQAWIGASTSDPFLVGGYSGNLAAGWGGLVLLGVGSLSLTQVINEIKLWNDRNERVPVNIEDIVLGDNTNQVPVYPIPTEIYLPGSSMYATLNGVTTGATEYFKLLGVAIGYGKLLKRNTFA
jgi:hypothetical protein